MTIYSTAVHAVLLLPLVMSLCDGQESVPKNELGFTLGGIPSLSRSTSLERLDLGSGTVFGINYGRRFVSGEKIALYGEINFLGSPLRDVTSNIVSATKNFASLYLTPGIRVKFFPKSAISPYAAIGGGYGEYEQSTTRLDGQPNPASRQLSRGVFDFGAGVDVHIWRFIALRGDARDFYSGAPAYNLASIAGGQHNISISGGFVLRWH